MLIPQQDFDCEYINTHLACLDAVNCNTNVQIEDISQVDYSTLYWVKSMQKEDSEGVQQILHKVIEWLLKIEENILLGKGTT
jgi:hypothetical protein